MYTIYFHIMYQRCTRRSLLSLSLPPSSICLWATFRILERKYCSFIQQMDKSYVQYLFNLLPTAHTQVCHSSRDWHRWYIWRQGLRCSKDFSPIHGNVSLFCCCFYLQKKFTLISRTKLTTFKMLLCNKKYSCFVRGAQQVCFSIHRHILSY